MKSDGTESPRNDAFRAANHAKMLRIALTIFLVVSLGGTTAAAQDTSGIAGANPLGLFANVDVGYSFRRNIQENNVDQSVSYLSQDFSVLDLRGNAGMLRESFFTFEYQRTFSNAGFQQEIVSSSLGGGEGLEIFKVGAILDPIIRLLAPNLPLVRAILSLRFKYVHEITQTEAIVNENSIYLPSGASVDYASQSTSTYVDLPKGSSYFLKTIYNYTESTIRFPIQLGPLFGAIRLGYANWEYRRPFSTRHVHLNNCDVIYDASPHVGAVVMVLEPLDGGSPGFHVDWTTSYGVDNIFNSSLDWHRVHEFSQPNTEVQYDAVRVELDAWYNLYFEPRFARGIFLTIGGSISGFEFNIQHYQTSNDNSNSQVLTEVKNGDSFARLWASVSLRF